MYVIVYISELSKYYVYINIYCIYLYIHIVTVHTSGRNEEHGDVDKLKLTVFNKGKARQGKARQGKARQGKADTQEHRGVTSRPDEKELKRQELNTQVNNKHNQTQLDKT